MLRALVAWSLSYRLLVLALTLVLYPFADDNRSVRAVAQLLDIAVVLSVMRMLRVHDLWLRSGWTISVPLVLLQLAHLAHRQAGKHGAQREQAARTAATRARPPRWFGR